MTLLSDLDPWAAFGLVLALSVAAALALHGAVYGVLNRIRRSSPERLPLRGHLVERTERSARWALGLGALRTAWTQAPLLPDAPLREGVASALYVLLVLALARLATRAVSAVNRSLGDRLDLSKADNLSERRLLTQIGVLWRVLNVGIAIVALALVFLHFETFRRVGAGLLASAGIAGVVLGFAAQRVLGNVLAGIQIAISQPIRVDDVVVVEGEWARVEEITLTYVVVRIWDLRRLVLPISYFIETPFQNWTRSSARVIGTVYLRTDYSVPVEAVRAEVGRIVEASEYFDGDVWRLHVTDLGEQVVELRALATAANADHAWELRCEIREALLAWLREAHPEALPRTRIVVPEGRLPETPATLPGPARRPDPAAGA